MKFNHVPAYGFGRAKKCEIEKTDPLYNPGPGNYAPNKSGYKYPSWKIGTEKRGGKNSSFAPGPGAYSIPETFTNGPKYSMATKAGAFDPSKSSYTPGPGAYDPSSLNRPTSAKYTMRSKPNSKGTESMPGPGNYNLRTDKQLVVPSYKFGTEKKDGLNLASGKFAPGPGNYEYNADVLHQKYPKFSFGKETRGQDLRPKTPGPGSYEYKRFLGKEAPKITMSAKYGGMNYGEKSNPGPGAYNEVNPSNYRNKMPSYRIGTGKRRGLYDSSDNPGPGAYGPENLTNYVRPKTPSWKIGTGKRPDLNPGDKTTPGVGNYNVSKAIGTGGPKYTMVGKGNMGGIGNVNPGPGAYNETKAAFRKYPSWKIGTGTRDDNLKRIVRDGYPGPGMYEYYDKTKVKAPHYKFGTEKRGYVKKSDTPGPGNYHIPCAIVDVNDYTREQGTFDPHYRYI